MLALLLLAGCPQTVMTVGDTQTDPHDDEDTAAPDDTAEPDDTADTGGPDDSGETGDTDETGDTGDPDPPDPVEYDCDALPDFNLGDQTLSEARAYHGITFDDDGHLIGWDARNALIKSRYDGTREVFVPGLRQVEQMDRLPDGDFVVADAMNGQLLRVTPDGGTETLASNTSGTYGVTVGPDGMVYIADGGVHRIDPATGTKTTLLSSPPRSTAHAVNFNLDSTVMYIGTIGRGDVFYFDLDENLDPVGDLQLYAPGVGTGWHDAIGVDACGNLYVPDYYSASLYRVAPDGTITEMVEGGNTLVYGHGVAWGSGYGGWRNDAIYLPLPYGGATVRELILGVPTGDTVRTWNGVKAPW